MIQTESAGGVVLNGGLVLIVSQHKNFWGLPKGHIEKGEDKLTAAKREILEESGVNELTLVKELGAFKRPRLTKYGKDDAGEMKTIHIFLFTTKQTALNPAGPNNPQAKWVPKEKAGELLTHLEDKKFYASILNKI